MSKQQRLLQQVINGLLLFIVIGLLGALSVRYKFEADWTAGHRNTLTPASQKLLKGLSGPLHFLEFDYPSSQNRQSVQTWVDRYKRFKPDTTLEFIDPSREPGKVKQYNVDEPGEAVIEYQGRKEVLRAISEPLITSAIQRLADSGEHNVLFLDGHGEHAISGDAKDGYTHFVAALKEKGLKVDTINLIKTPKVPENTSALVIARPTQKLLDGEVAILTDYVKKGGNLLWLVDPDTAPGLESLSQAIGLTWLSGYVVFPEAQAVGSPNPLFYLAAAYPDNPVTGQLDLVTLFPLVRALKVAEVPGWNAQTMLQTDESSWLDVHLNLDNSDKPITLDQQPDDPKGPLKFGAIFTHELAAAGPKPVPGADPAAAPKPVTQRVAVIGNSEFIADSYLDLAGNKQLGLNVVQWLAARDAQLNIDVPKAPDANLIISDWKLRILGAVFILFIPLGLLGYGLTRWVGRRRR